jgi:hypothetical protein
VGSALMSMGRALDELTLARVREVDPALPRRSSTP